MHQDMYVKALVLYLLILVTAAHRPLNFTEMKARGGGSGSNMILLPLHGNVYPLGRYTVKISIGQKNPPTEFVFDIDTGSDLTWVPSSGTNGPPPYYDPKHEPGSSIVMCFEPECKALGGDDSNCDRASNEPCSYTIKYADGVSYTGALFKDSFHLELSNGRKVAPRIAFGCAVAPDPIHDQGIKGGIIGLDKGLPGILHQLSKPDVNLIRNVVGHCLSSSGRGGFVFLGINDNLPRNMVWQPLVKGRKHYSLGSADLLFDGKSVQSVRGLQIIFDSGSTYTYFNTKAYRVVAFLIYAKLQGLPGRPLNLDRGDRTLPICWKGPQPFGSIKDAAKYFPNLVLSFAPNVQFFLSPKHYLVISEPAGNACLGILDGTQVGLGDMNLIGDISMQDKWVVYDNQNARVGWAGVQSCS